MKITFSPETLQAIKEIQEDRLLIETLDDVVSFLVDYDHHSSDDNRDLSADTLDCVKTVRNARRILQQICVDTEGGAA
jgi:hypothetical protein